MDSLGVDIGSTPYFQNIYSTLKVCLGLLTVLFFIGLASNFGDLMSGAPAFARLIFQAVSELLETLKPKLDGQFKPLDSEQLDSGRLRWQNRAQFVRRCEWYCRGRFLHLRQSLLLHGRQHLNQIARPD